MAGDDAVFIDTNVLVYAKLAKAPLHALAAEQLRRLDKQGIELSRKHRGRILLRRSQTGLWTVLTPIPRQ